MNSDPRSDPCFGWGAYASSHELVHYKHVAAAAASLLKDSFDKCAALTLSCAYFALTRAFGSIQMPLPPGCTLRKHLWDVQSQFALPVEIVASILAT
jgi:hypothetical protein